MIEYIISATNTDNPELEWFYAVGLYGTIHKVDDKNLAARFSNTGIAVLTGEVWAELGGLGSLTIYSVETKKI